MSDQDELFERVMAESDSLYALSNRLFAQAGFNPQKRRQAKQAAQDYAEVEDRLHRIYRAAKQEGKQHERVYLCADCGAR